MFRRKRLPADLEAPYEGFQEVLRRVEEAKEALVRAVPMARNPGRPLADGLAEYEAGLEDARELMTRWRAPVVERHWEACREGLERALEVAERFRLDTPDLAFDMLMFALQDLMAPLDAFEQAEQAFRRLRTR